MPWGGREGEGAEYSVFNIAYKLPVNRMEETSPETSRSLVKTNPSVQ